MIDERNQQLLDKRIENRNKIEGPRIGDFVIKDGQSLRFTYDWGVDIQTTVPSSHPCSGDMSFHLHKDGEVGFSGSLDHAIPKDKLRLTDEVRNGSFWFFKDDWVTAHNGILVNAPCRVYAYE